MIGGATALKSSAPVPPAGRGSSGSAGSDPAGLGALGARPAGIARLMVRQHLAGAWAGVAIGAMLGAWLAYGVGAFLYRTGPFDPLAWGAALFVVTGTIALGALVPALRASRVDPVRALRVE